MGYGKIKIGEQWWIWDEREEVLKDSRGTIKRQKQRSRVGSDGREERQNSWKEGEKDIGKFTSKRGEERKGGLEGGFLKRGRSK